MKISKETLDVLSNFSNINESILFLEGNLQKTISKLKTGYAEVVFAESFPQEFAIYDLPTFLGILSLFKEPDVDFSKTSVIITEGTQKATYRFCNPSLIVHPPKDKSIGIGEIIYTFELTADNLKLLTKAVNLYGHEHIAIEADGEKIVLKTLNVKERDSDGMSYVLGETDQKFKRVLKVEYLNLLPHSYDVKVSERMMQFDSKNMELKYFVPCEVNAG